MSTQHFGFVIASSLPLKLAEFYSFAFEGELKSGYTNDDFSVSLPGGVNIYIYKPSRIFKELHKDSFTSLCVHSDAKEKPLDYLKDWLKTLVLKGSSVSVEPKLDDFGAEAWLKDPDGNRFLLFVPQKNRGFYD